jgi:hypothetical protein
MQPQNTKNSSLSLWVGVIGLTLTLFSAFVSAAIPKPAPDLKTTLNQVVRQGQQIGEGDRQSRCSAAAEAAIADGDSRPREALISVCLALPMNHATACGLPSSTDEYMVVENQKCTGKMAGLSLSHAHARKVEARIRPADEPYEEGDGGSTIAQ